MSNKYFTCLLFLLIILGGCTAEEETSATAASSSGSSSYNTGFEVRGRILAAGNTAKDNDVNDPKVPLSLRNNTKEFAQSIPNPVILGGYVAQLGEGPSGQLNQVGDKDDYFVADLRAGQVINLFVANENLAGNDLDLTLLDMAGAVLNASVSEGATEELTVSENGRYFIRVNAYSGASNYLLSIGQTYSSSHGLRLSDDFVPYEVIVKFKEENLRVVSALGLQTATPDFSRRQLFTIDQTQSRLLSEESMPFATPELQEKYETLMKVKQLRKQAEIAEASPNYQIHSLSVPNDTLYRYQWNLPLLNLPAAWDLTTGENSIVAIIDSGVLLNHPDLQGKLVAGYDFIRSTRISLDGDGIDDFPEDPGDQSPNGSSFHGTHVAGIIAASSNNNRGVAGIGWQTKVMPLRVLGKGGAGSDYDIEQAMRFAAGLPNDSGMVPPKRADIINLSLGGPIISSGFQDLIYDVRQAGVTVVAASGNDGTGTLIYPASLEGVVSVGAVDINKAHASYSNYGAQVDIAAPGGDNTPDINGDGVPDSILSTVGNEVTQANGQTKIEYTFATSVGTSMAAPHVAGVVALMKAVNPGLTPEEVDELLSAGKMTEDLGNRGRDDEFGYGLINAQKAVLNAIELRGGLVSPQQPKLVVNPRSLNFGSSNSTLTLNLSNGGGGDLRVESITDNSGGVLSIQGTGLGEYLVSVRRNLLTSGTFTATITIMTNVDTMRVPVILQVGDSENTGDVGLLYVLLIQPDTWETVQQTQAVSIHGIYDFRFNNVAADTYWVVAGSDTNNDGYICDIGEACGAYLVVRDPTPIEVNGQVRLSDFSAGFEVDFVAKTTNQRGLPRVGLPRFKLLGSK